MPKENNQGQSIPVFAKLVLKHDLVSREALGKALKSCAGSSDVERDLVRYLLENHLISAQDLKRMINLARTLEMRQKEIRFGAIAMEKGYITKSVLQLALDEQKEDLIHKRKLRRIGDILVDAGMFTEKQRDTILQMQNRLKTMPAGQPAAGQEMPDTAKTPESENNPESAPDKPAVASGSPAAGAVEAEPEGGTGMTEPVMIEGGLTLQVSSDLFAAYLTKTAQFDDTLTVEDIKTILVDHDIIFGFTGDDMIEGFLKSKGFKTKAFRVARGVKPVEGKDARIEYFFNTDHLTAGGIDKEGNIDFRDRGGIPLVEQGTVLAEKIPAVTAKTGKNIYGEEILAEPESDVPLKFGKGARLSEDGLKIIAAVSGYPKFTLSEVVLVHEEYEVDGDVDYETGHVDYSGNVVIKGCIKSGFKVSANNIKAMELDGGIIVAEGDLIIQGGINEAQVYAKGNVQAKFIHKSTISAMGNILVEKEIVDSNLESYGGLLAKNGKVIASKVACKMGAFVKTIGTETAAHSVFRIGQDPFMEKELKKNQALKEAVQKEIDGLVEKRSALEKESRHLQQMITELAHIQDRAQLRQREIESALSGGEKDLPDHEDGRSLQEELKQLRADAADAEKKLDESFDQSDKIESSIEQIRRKIDMEKTKLESLVTERKNLLQLTKANPANPCIEVGSVLMPGTAVIGKHSEKKFQEMIRNANIREVACTVEDGSCMGMYEIRVMNR